MFHYLSLYSGVPDLHWNKESLNVETASVCPSVDDLALRNKPFSDFQAFGIQLMYMKFSSKGDFRENLFINSRK